MTSDTRPPTPDPSNLAPQTSAPFPIFCDCCPHAPKKMAVLQGGVMEIVGRHGGKKHRVKVDLVDTTSGE